MRTSKKLRGRPKTTGVGTLVGVRLLAGALGRLDTWVSKQKDKPSRPEAIRRLVEVGLKAKRPERFYTTMTVPERIELARSKMTRVIDHLLNLMEVHANNEIITYSPLLASQIPASHAAKAFNVVQHSLHCFELVRLCALWDGIDQEKENIPTVVGLIDDPNIIELLVQECISHWAKLEDGDPDATFRNKEGEKTRTALVSAIADSMAIRSSDKLLSILNVRDKSLAHSLSTTHRERAGPVAAAKYGYERDLLSNSISIVKALYLGVNGADFDLESSQRRNRRNAKSLWEGCTFQIK